MSADYGQRNGPQTVAGVVKQRMEPTFGTVQAPPNSSFSQILDSYKPNYAALCAGYNGWDAAGRLWHHWVKTAECFSETGDPRQIKLTCGAFYQISNSRYHRRHHIRPDKFLHPECPLGTVCQMVMLINKGDGGPLEQAGCVDLKQLMKETVRSNPTKSNQKVHCGLTLALPGPDFIPAPGQHKIDLVLTEQVQFPNGSAYPAPLLYIREISDARQPDRAFRRDANVASAQIELGVYRGSVLSKSFEFCMQMLPGHVLSSAIFTYSFFQVELHHGRISDQPEFDPID